MIESQSFLSYWTKLWEVARKPGKMFLVSNYVPGKQEPGNCRNFQKPIFLKLFCTGLLFQTLWLYFEKKSNILSTHFSFLFDIFCILNFTHYIDADSHSARIWYNTLIDIQACSFLLIISRFTFTIISTLNMDLYKLF